MKEVKQKAFIQGFTIVTAFLLVNSSFLQAQSDGSLVTHPLVEQLVQETLVSNTPVVQSELKQETHTGHDASAMNHADMQMQGGNAPSNARDPHAYSAGHTLEKGPYVLSGPRQLVLADEHTFWALLGERFEVNQHEKTGAYDLQGWVGTTYDRLLIKAEGDVSDSRVFESQTELLWGHAISTYWDSQLGVRIDSFDEGRDRQWLAFGLQGLAPYWFELDLTGYLGNNGRTALSFRAEYELMLTQRLVLQPHAELTLYGKEDAANRLGSGPSDGNIGLRLRYEFSRQFAPYLGVEWESKFGQTAKYTELIGEADQQTRYVAGIRFWF